VFTYLCPSTPAHIPRYTPHPLRETLKLIATGQNCGDVLTKKKLDPHRNQCYGASYTCLDCMVHFPGTSYRTHTVCLALPVDFVVYSYAQYSMRCVCIVCAPKICARLAFVLPER
jgi:hypothetical protein